MCQSFFYMRVQNKTVPFHPQEDVGTHCEGGVSMGGKAEMEELPPKSTKGCSVGIWSMQPFTSIFVYFLQLDYHFQFHNKLVWLF